MHIEKHELAILNQIVTVQKNKSAICNNTSCIDCIFGYDKGGTIEDIYDNEGDNYTLCSAISSITDTVDDILRKANK
jgi:hypothetical protein